MLKATNMFVLAVALLVLGAASSAMAGDFYHGGHGHFHGYAPTYRSTYYPSYQTYPLRSAYYPATRVHRTWHDTSHLHYHPTEVIRHGNHFHVQPGHFDVHRTGHYDYHSH